MGAEFLKYANRSIEEIFLFYYSQWKCDNESKFSKNNINQSHELNFIILVIIILKLLPLIKFFIVIFYFFVYSLLVKLFKILSFTFRQKCKVRDSNICEGCIDTLLFYIRKIYTYNYYSFEKIWHGVILVPIYIFFLLVNIIFVSHFINTSYIKDDCIEFDNILEIIQILSFVSHNFIEIFTSFYYFLNNLDTTIICTMIYFTISEIISNFSIIYSIRN